MAYEMVMPYHLHMPSYFLETFTEYPLLSLSDRPVTISKACGVISIAFGVNSASFGDNSIVLWR